MKEHIQRVSKGAAEVITSNKKGTYVGFAVAIGLVLIIGIIIVALRSNSATGTVSIADPDAEIPVEQLRTKSTAELEFRDFTYRSNQLGISFEYLAASKSDIKVELQKLSGQKLKDFAESKINDPKMIALMDDKLWSQTVELDGNDAYILSSRTGDVQNIVVMVSLKPGEVVMIYTNRDSIGPLITSFKA